jgi:transcriptional regulator with XRE-family HTH domain
MTRGDQALSDLRAFAENLRRARQANGMSQMDLGRACDVHPTVIARIETANREPRLTTITKLARGLGIPAADLFRDT